jgi:hypothetical protein
MNGVLDDVVVICGNSSDWTLRSKMSIGEEIELTELLDVESVRGVILAFGIGTVMIGDGLDKPNAIVALAF